jgi:DNA polymerase-3 subunit delta
VIYIFHGGDSYSLREALDGLRAGVGPPELQSANTTVFSGQEVTLNSLLGPCCAVPFLAERRLVVVEGLLATTEPSFRPGPGQALRRAGGGQSPEGRGGRTALPSQWQGLQVSLQKIAPTTDLVFVDGPLRRDNPFLQELATVAQVREFAPLAVPDLERWIAQQASRRGAAIASDSIRLLADLIASDLWTLGNELEKLALYCHGRQIEVEDVEALVSPAREASIFAAVDAVLEHSSQRALQLVSRLLEGGTTVARIMTMLARQVRLLLLAQELLQTRVPQDELGRRLGIASAFPLRKTLEQARRSTPEELRRLHTLLLEAEIAMKTGAQEERPALELLVARICQEAGEVVPPRASR